VPLARAWSRVFWSAALFFSISAHWARGIAQLLMYEYMGGFSLTSDVCARIGAAKTAAMASAHSPAKTLLNILFMKLSLREVPGFDPAS
jgi:hypothetical protein